MTYTEQQQTWEKRKSWAVGGDRTTPSVGNDEWKRSSWIEPHRGQSSSNGEYNTWALDPSNRDHHADDPSITKHDSPVTASTIDQRASLSNHPPPINISIISHVPHRTSTAPTTEDLKHYYTRLINSEFRALQLDKSLSAKSLFDLIDYCELLYEKSTSTPDGTKRIKYYIKGYLVFNYFINSLVMFHFKGFDAFIERNHQDFIIYLNIFAFYNTNDTIFNSSYTIPQTTLRRYILSYLVDKKLLTFDVDDLYAWLHAYIDYLKQKDQEGQDDGAISPVSSSPTNSLDSDYATPIMLNFSYQTPSTKSYNLNIKDDSILDFQQRYPSLKLSANSINAISAHSRSSLDPPPKSPPPPPPPSQHKTHKEPPHKAPPLPPHEAPPLPPHQYAPINEYATKKSATMPTIPYPKEDLVTPLAYPLETNYSVEELTFRDQSSETRARSMTPVANGSEAYSSHKPQVPYRSQFSTSTPQIAINPQYQNHEHNGYSNGSNGYANGPNGYANGPIGHANGHPQNYMNPFPQQYGYPQASFTPNQYYPPVNQNVLYNVPPHVQQKQSQIKNQKRFYMETYKICGLRNFGSSCYINLTVQLLFGVLQFKNFINEPYINERLRGRGSPLALTISGLLETFNKHGGNLISPTKFIRISSQLKPDFNIPNEQQDAQEFLLFILEKLHTELSNKSLISDEEIELYIGRWDININMKDKSEWLKWYKSILTTEGTSPVNDLFQGQLQNTLTCGNCKYESINFSTFTILSLPIPSRNANVINLSDCLRYYTQDEVLSGENAWNCPKCGKKETDKGKKNKSVLDSHPVFTPKRSGIFKLKRSKSPNPASSSTVLSSSSSTKSLTFIKLPKILFIHLSRFSMYNLTDKLDVMINYPLELMFAKQGQETKYKLTGLINHYGNLKSGHYTALVDKAGGSAPYWCLFDDDNIKLNVVHGHGSQGELCSRDVYVLCYERVSG